MISHSWVRRSGAAFSARKVYGGICGAAAKLDTRVPAKVPHGPRWGIDINGRAAPEDPPMISGVALSFPQRTDVHEASQLERTEASLKPRSVIR